MKKASRVLTLILIAVLVLGIFSGCGMFGRNSEKYRSQVVMTVGKEEITAGKFIDTFNNYYNTYGYYVQLGYYSIDDIVELTVSSLVSQFMKVDAYKTSGAQTYQHKWATSGLSFKNQEYLTPDEMAYTIKYIKYVLFTTLDSLVDGYVAADYDLKAEETEDTSRDFFEYDKLGDYDTYSEYLYMQNFKNEDMDKYLEKNYNGIELTTDNISVDKEYVYQSAAAAKDRLDALNARLEDDSKQISYDDYKAWQEKALKQYKKSVKNAYDYDLDQLITNQVEDYILSVIVAKYNREIYTQIDNSDDNLKASAKELQKLYDSLKANQEAGFNVNNNFVSFIEGLTDSTFIYNIPEAYKDSYIYVKNILIPFDDNQTAILSYYEKMGNATDNDEYIKLRNQYAAQIVAEDFLTEKDDDKDENDKIENVFLLQGDKLIVNPDAVLGEYFKSEGKVEPMEGLSANDTIIELMKRFNTDIGQHSTLYDYVVRIDVDSDDDNYKAPWVQEFVDGAKEAYASASGADGGTYALAVSSYGVHIVYYSGKVVAQDINFEEMSLEQLMDTTTPAYRMFKNFFTKKADQLTEADTHALQEAYYPSKIKATSKFNGFMKDNKFTFDLDAFLDLSKD